MNSDHEDDPILDACLSEVLGGHAPPDLAARIVSSNGHCVGGSIETLLASVPEAPPVVALPPVAEVPEEFLFGRTTAKRRNSQFVAAAIAVAAGFVGLAVVIGSVALLKTPQRPIAKAPAPEIVAPLVPKVNPAPAASEEVVSVPARSGKIFERPAPEPQAIADAPATRETAPRPQTPSPPDPEPRSLMPQMPPVARQSSPDSTVISFVNAEFARIWKEAGVRPTAAITDAEWCQRVFARILGRAATSDELKELAEDKSASRREKLVRRLLTDKKYTGQFANRWAVLLVPAFLGRSSAPSPNAPSSREDLQKYLSSALAANKSYGQIAIDLLTATGSPRPGAADYNPAVNFLLDGMTGDATAPTIRVGRVMLGHQMQCAQCHDHPSQGWSQEQFWGLNACFRQLRVERRDNAVRLVAAARAPNVRTAYETPDGSMRTATPHFIDGSEIAGTDGGSNLNLLSELAQRVVQSDDFCRASVNRIWAQLFDYGFTRPVDDLGPNSVSADAAVLERLAGEFAGHDFDLKKLIHWAVLSEPFSRSGKLSDLASKDMPEEGELPLFSRFYSRPSRSTDAFASLSQVARIRSSGSSEREMERARIDWLAQANRAVTKAPSKTAPVIDNPAIMIKGGESVQLPASGDPTGLVKKIAASEMSYERKSEHLFLAVLGRQPTQRERRAAGELLRIAGENHSIALDDLWWSLQNSSESIFDR